jgi:1-acyl-sn-glycerol-3-phosphate acyltransferase
MLALLHCARRLLAIFDFLALTLLALLAALPPRALHRHYYPRLFHAWCRSFVRALDVDLRLYQHYPGKLPARYILIANHPSAFEDIGIPALFKVRSLAKAEVADWLLVGRIATAAGTLYVERESSESRKAAGEALKTAAVQGDCIAVYPEGGCKGRRLASRFFNGAFNASFESGVPILPVFLHYPAQEDFEWADQSLLRKIYEIATSRHRRADYHVFAPIDPRGFESAEAMKAHCYALYLGWQARFLE